MTERTPAGQNARPSTWRVIRLVGGREISTRFHSKAWRVTTLLLVTLAVGVSVLIKATGGPDRTLDVGVTSQTQALGAALVATGSAVGVTIETTLVDSEAAGRDQVASGDLNALLVGDGSSVQVVVDQDLGVNLNNTLTVLARELATQQQITALGGNPAEFRRAVASATVDVERLQPPKSFDDQHLALGVIAGVLIFVSLQFSGQFIAQGVVEEKSTRVVELLLSTVRPWELIAGKVLGIGALGLAQLALIAGSGLVAAQSLGTLSLSVPSAVGTLIWLIVWFVLGFFAYALALAAAAALVSRQEDVGAVMMPVLSFLIVGYMLGVSVLPSDPENTLARVLSILPPFAPALMPIRQAMGAASAVDVIAAVVLMLATIPALAWLSGRIYRNAVMRTGARVRLRDALRAD